MAKVFTNVRQLLSINAIPKPRWYDVVLKHPPQSYPGRKGHLKNIVFPEDALRKVFYKRFPEVEAVPFYDTHGKNLCDEFVSVHKSKLAEGLTKEEAMAKAEQHIREQQIKAKIRATDLRPQGQTDTQALGTVKEIFGQVAGTQAPQRRGFDIKPKPQ
eukprot:comp18992_c0_seq1/m.21336 comp18992_c0_seq1/g.21336  ORF comp18992_c0_seq1/g.21336 comp18992_c0_seq1/m.21336 type:complete len:158 (-) comp18992_c0_seq1:83-556(-)